MPSIESVEIRKVVKTFGATAALRGVDAELSAGALTIVEGPNGSGKSTLLRVVGTILRPTAGVVDYRPLGRDLDRVRAEIGWVSHEALAYADLSGKENILLAARLHGIDPQSAWDSASERFELGRFAERALRTNSRGQRQRIALARALVHEPSLVLLDEPSTGLDKSGVARLVELVEREVASGAIVALVTHEPELFASVPAKRLSLRRGRVADG